MGVGGEVESPDQFASVSLGDEQALQDFVRRHTKG